MRVFVSKMRVVLAMLLLYIIVALASEYKYTVTLHKVYFYWEYYVSGFADYTTDDASYTIDLLFIVLFL